MRAITAVLMIAGIALQAQTPPPADTPARTIFDPKQNLKKPDPLPPAKPVSAPASAGGVPRDSQRDAGSSALDALATSTENLNTIRDGNVRKLTADGCAPEVSARLADLRARLGIRATPKKDTGSETAALALASAWYKTPEESKPAAAQQKTTDLLESVLPGPSKSPKPADPQARDAGALKDEMDRLLASCSGAKQ